MKPAPLFLACTVLAGCSSPSPTEPAALARQVPAEALLTPAPTPIPRLTLFTSPGGILKGAPCFPNPYTKCGVPETWPTPAPGATPNPGNWPTTIPGTSHVTIWPSPTPTPELP